MIGALIKGDGCDEIERYTEILLVVGSGKLFSTIVINRNNCIACAMSTEGDR